MLRFVTDSLGNGSITRREWLRLGCSAWAGMPAALAAASSSAARSSGFGKAKSVLLVYTSGGQSQLETWDPKPNAPVEIRGEFRPIATSVPGTIVGEHMPQLARLANLYTIIRSASHDDTDHGSASYLALTGQFHARKSSNPLAQPSDLPTYGAIVKRVQPSRKFPYSAVHVNGPALVPEIIAPGQFGGLLGKGCDPLLIGDVSHEVDVLRSLEDVPELPPVRLDARRSLLQSVDRYCHELQQNPAALELSGLYRQAYEMLSSRACRQAFDLTQEPSSLRDRYGRHRSGQACLLGRRLVEAGVPFITVIWNHTNRGQDKDPGDTDVYGWDTHNDIFESLKVHLLPRFDQSFATLLQDLQQRGLLDQTLVVCMGEFGRAPLVALEPKFAGSSPGRKHWASVYSLVMAGAGVARGGVLGSSDRMGAYPQAQAVTPGDIAATMFAALGIDPAGHYTDPAARPYAICTGKPIRELYE